MLVICCLCTHPQPVAASTTDMNIWCTLPATLHRGAVCVLRRRDREHPGDQRRLGQLQCVCGSVLGQAALRVTAETCAMVSYCWTRPGLRRGRPGCRRVREQGPVTCRRGFCRDVCRDAPSLSWAAQALPSMSMVRVADFGFPQQESLCRRHHFVLFLPSGSRVRRARSRGSGACRYFFPHPIFCAWSRVLREQAGRHLHVPEEY